MRGYLETVNKKHLHRSLSFVGDVSLQIWWILNSPAAIWNFIWGVPVYIEEMNMLWKQKQIFPLRQNG